MKISTKVAPQDGTRKAQVDAYTAIKELIFDRSLNPGQKLLYQDLTDMIGVSKTPITNALSRLNNEGFLDYEVNRGFRVRRIDETEISELIDVRMELELFNVRNAIKNLNAENLQRLTDKFTSYASYKPIFTDRKKIMLDLEFHLEIARAGGNSYSIMFCKTIIEHIFFRYRLERWVDRRRDEKEYEHQSIFECIKRKDTKGAVGHMRKHLKTLHGLMLEYMEEYGTSGRVKMLK